MSEFRKSEIVFFFAGMIQVVGVLAIATGIIILIARLNAQDSFASTMSTYAPLIYILAGLLCYILCRKIKSSHLSPEALAKEEPSDKAEE